MSRTNDNSKSDPMVKCNNKSIKSETQNKTRNANQDICVNQMTQTFNCPTNRSTSNPFNGFIDRGVNGYAIRHSIGPQRYFRTYNPLPVHYNHYWNPCPNPLLTPNPYPNASAKRATHERECHYMSEKIIRQMVCKYRSFTPKEANKKSNGFEFSLMTYNILSQNLLEDHSQLYQHCRPSSLQWPDRGHRILRELLESDADIICLQEVHSKHFNDLLMPALKEKGYSFVYKRKTGDKVDGCAVLYKDNRFSMSNAIKLEFMRQDLSSILDRDNIALIVKLKTKDSNDSTLIVANTHLLFNPRRGDVKMAQIRLLLAELDKMALICQKEESVEYNPIILCGDLNSEPNSSLYNFITSGSADFSGLKIGDISGQREGSGRGRDVQNYHLNLLGVTSDSRFEDKCDNENEMKDQMFVKHNFRLKSVYEKVKNSSGDEYISTYNRFESGLVDHIFYDYTKLQLMASQTLMTRRQIQKIGGIPNTYLGSDHLALKAKFIIK